MEGKAKTEKGKGFSRFREVYPISEPYAYAAVIREPNTQRTSYEVIEPTLLEREKTQLEDLKDILMAEIDINLKDLKTRERAKEYLQDKVKETIKDYNLKIAAESIDKFMYFITRDFIGYGRIDPFMKDHLIEDISADGVNIPIYIWHRKYESLPTNIRFRDVNELNSFIVRLAYLAKKNVSIASPMLDASLPDGSRIQLTYGN